MHDLPIFDPEPFYPSLAVIRRPRNPGRHGGDQEAFGTGFYVRDEEVFGKSFCAENEDGTKRATLVTAAHNLTKQTYNGREPEPDPEGELLPEVEICCYDEAANNWTVRWKQKLEEGVNCWLDRVFDSAIVRVDLSEGYHPGVLSITEEIASGDTVAVLGFQSRLPDQHTAEYMRCMVPINWPFDEEGSLNYELCRGHRLLESGISGGSVLKVSRPQSGCPAVAIHKGREGNWLIGTPLALVLGSPKLLVKVVGLLAEGKFGEAEEASGDWGELKDAGKQYASGIGYLEAGEWKDAKGALQEAHLAFEKLGQPVDLAFISAALEAADALQACAKPVDSRTLSLLPPEVRKSVRRINRGVRLYRMRRVWLLEAGVLLACGILALAFVWALWRASLSPVPCTMTFEADGQPLPGPQYSVERPAGSLLTIKVVLKEPTGGDIDPNGATFDWGFYPEDSIVAIGNRNYTLHYQVPDDGQNYQVIVVNARIGARYCHQVLEINITE